MIINGDCLEVMRGVDENSIDSIVTDPPYELGFMGKKWDSSGISYKVELWRECLRILKPGAHLLAFGSTRTYHRIAVAIEDAGFEIRDQIMWVYGTGFPKSLNIGKSIDKHFGYETEQTIIGYNKQGSKIIYDSGKSRPVSLPAKEYDGWGSALKPAIEPICVARKPISEKTIAENVLRWKTGGLNIDGSRVEMGEYQKELGALRTKSGGDASSSLGHFPANLIHDGSDEVLKGFPETVNGYINNEKRIEYGLGPAARFFYCAKSDPAERDHGLGGFEGKERIRQGLAGEKDNTISRNPHPTVKPIDLMRYLVKLVTPKGGIVLDPFMGSGSTGIACKLEQFEFIGIDLNKEYCEIAEARIKAWNYTTIPKLPKEINYENSLFD